MHNQEINNNNRFFSLKNNPFFLLKSLPNESIETLTDHYEDLVYEGNINEQYATKAYQSLCASLSRLSAEVSWLLGVPAQEAVFDLIDQADNSTRESWPAIAQINFLANQFANHPTDETVTTWLNLWNNLSNEEVLTLINQQRQLSHFPNVNLEQVNTCINQLRSQQIQALIYDVANYEKWCDWLLLHLQKDIEQPLLTSSLLSEIVTEASNLITATLEQQKEQIVTDLNTLCTQVSSEQEPLLLSKLEQTLQNWQHLTQPIDIARQRKGLQSQTITSILFADIVNNLYQFSQDHTNDLACLNLIIKVLDLADEYLIQHKDLEADIDRIRYSYCFDRNRLILKTLPTLETLYNDALTDLDSFFKQVIAGYFTDESQTNCLASDFFKELKQQLETNKDDTTRESIFTLLNSFYILNDDNTIRHIHGVISFIQAVKGLTKQYSFEPPKNFEDFKDLLKTFEAININTYLKHLYAQQNFANISVFLDYVIARITDNEDLVLDLKDIQKSVNKAKSQQSSNDVAAVLQVIVVIIMAFIMLIRCTS